MFQKATEIDETDINAWIGLGILYIDHLGKYEEGTKILKEAGQKDENSSLAWFILGTYYYQEGKYSEAELAFTKAVKLKRRKISEILIIQRLNFIQLL